MSDHFVVSSANRINISANILIPPRGRSFLASSLFLVFVWTAVTAAADPNPYAKWAKGPPSSPAFFPLAVWLQSPSNAERYRNAGFNTYVALWNGPTDEQLAALKKAGLRVICAQNEVAPRHLDDPAIIGWMHGD